MIAVHDYPHLHADCGHARDSAHTTNKQTPPTSKPPTLPHSTHTSQQASSGAFDLVVSADVLVYYGVRARPVLSSLHMYTYICKILSHH